MREIRQFGERLYDPNLGAGVSSTQILHQYLGDESLFISFTQVDKLGINPRSQYATPLGIYTYPLDAFFKKHVFPKIPQGDAANVAKAIGEFAPFAGKAKYVNLARYVGSESQIIRDIGDSSVYTTRDYESDMKRLQSWFVDMLAGRADSPVDQDQLAEGFVTMQKKAESEARVRTPGGYLWNVTRSVSSLMGTVVQGTAPVQWNKVLRELGYMAVVDLNNGVIHPNEPLQAVFFEKKFLKVIDRIENAAAAKKGKTFKGNDIRSFVQPPFAKWLELCRENGFSPRSVDGREELAKRLLIDLEMFDTDSMSTIVKVLIDKVYGYLIDAQNAIEVGELQATSKEAIGRSIRPFVISLVRIQEKDKIVSEEKMNEFENFWNFHVREMGLSGLQISTM